MNFHLFVYVCRPCGHRFMAPELPAADYGTLLLRGTRTGEMRLLHALEDATYDEVDAILRDESIMEGLGSAVRARILREVFGVACEPDAEGGMFVIGLRPRCPLCGSPEMAWWEATEPPQIVALDVPDVAHDEWSSLARAERIARVREAALEAIARAPRR